MQTVSPDAILARPAGTVIAAQRATVAARRLAVAAQRLAVAALVWLPPMLVIAPLLFLFVGAFAARWDSRGLHGVTLDGLRDGYQIVHASILFSVALAAAVAVLATLIAVPLAYVSLLSASRVMRLIRALIDLPVIVPALLLAMGLILAYPTLQGGWVLLLVAHTLQTIPFAMWPVVSALLLLDTGMLDTAGRTLGASPLQRFLLVVLPNVWRAAATGAATAFVMSFSETGSSLFLGSAQYRPIGVVLVDTFMNLDQRTSAAAAAIFTAVLLPALVGLELLLANRRTP